MDIRGGGGNICLGDMVKSPVQGQGPGQADQMHCRGPEAHLLHCPAGVATHLQVGRGPYRELNSTEHQVKAQVRPSAPQ